MLQFVSACGWHCSSFYFAKGWHFVYRFTVCLLSVVSSFRVAHNRSPNAPPFIQNTQCVFWINPIALSNPIHQRPCSRQHHRKHGRQLEVFHGRSTSGSVLQLQNKPQEGIFKIPPEKSTGYTQNGKLPPSRYSTAYYRTFSKEAKSWSPPS